MADDSKVVQLFRVNQLCASPDDVANYLEHLAKLVRSGDMTARKCCLIYIDQEGQTQYEPFGEQMSWMELAGMLEFAKLKVVST